MIANKIMHVAERTQPTLRNGVKRIAPYVLGLGLMITGAAKANSMPKDTFQKENVELTADTSEKQGPDKHMLGEAILGVGLLTYIGFGLYAQLSKKKDEVAENKQ